MFAKRHRVGVWVGIVMLWVSVASLAENEGKIALVMKALSNPFFIKMRDGAMEYAEKSDIQVEVYGIERETEVERQIGIIENLIAREYGAIVIAPADSKKLIPVCKKALEKGVVVINIDNPFHAETLKEYGISIPFVGSDNRVGAALVGNYLKRKMGNTGKAVILEGIRGVENAELRKQGFTEALTTDSAITVVASETANWHTDEAFSVMAELLQRHAAVDAVLCANDNMALGVIQALDIVGLAGRVWVGAYDNIEEIRSEMRNKRAHATIEQHPELMGAFGVKLAADALTGKEIPAYTPTPLDLITYESFDRKVGLSISHLANPFFASLQHGAQRAADLFGIRLVVADAGDDDAKQLTDLQAFMEAQVELMIINPTNADTVVPGIEMAQIRNIPVITVDRKSAREDLVSTHVASDNLAGGRMAGEFVADRLQGNGNVLELEGIPGTSAAYERGAGFNEVIGQHPGIHIIARDVADFDREKARSVMMRLLNKGLIVDAIFAHNDEMILGVIEAYEASKTKPPSVLVGFDATTEALKAVKQHRLTATIAQQPEEMGWQAVYAATQVFQQVSLPSEMFVNLELVEAE
jgi:ribose transport system substrate-binding protein